MATRMPTPVAVVAVMAVLNVDQRRGRCWRDLRERHRRYRHGGAGRRCPEGSQTQHQACGGGGKGSSRHSSTPR
jgi:hypothetical protein